MKPYHLLFCGIQLLALAACQNASPQATQAHQQDIPPVYVTVVGHIEDLRVYAQCDAYGDYRQKLLAFAKTLAQTGVRFNLQVEYEFWLGVSRCETDALRAATGGLNVLEYLVARYNFELDVHQEGGVEEGQDNYADIRYLAGTLSAHLSETAGGLVWEDAAQFTRLSAGETGWLYPEFTWSPQVLTLAVSRVHHKGDFSQDDTASGVWRPRGAGADFWIHDPNGPLIYIGAGEHDDWGRTGSNLSTPDFVQILARDLEAGNLDRQKMYTASLAVPQSVIFDAAQHPRLLALLEQIAPLVEAGRVCYVTYRRRRPSGKTNTKRSPIFSAGRKTLRRKFCYCFITTFWLRARSTERFWRSPARVASHCSTRSRSLWM